MSDCGASVEYVGSVRGMMRYECDACEVYVFVE